MSIRPQILTAMIALAIIGMTSLIIGAFTEVIVVACITGIVGLGMALLKE